MKKKILYIEDDETNRTLMTKIMSITDFDLHLADDGVDGFEKVKVLNPDLILLDLRVPRLGGYSVIKQLKADAQFRHVPIIVVTAFCVTGEREKCLKAGCDSFISKPFEFAALLSEINAQLNATPLNKKSVHPKTI